jgi:beta-galactosidase/beta-glucuronidase
MEDFMKRVAQTQLEPFFKLHKDADHNIVGNWVGQNTEDTFYDLADGYGLMISSMISRIGAGLQHRGARARCQ